MSKQKTENTSSSNLSQTKITSSRKFRTRKIAKPIKYSSDSETESIKTKSSKVKGKIAITRTQKLSDFTILEGPQKSNRTEMTNNNQPTLVVGSQVDKIDGIFIWSFLNAQDQASFSAQKLPVESSQQNIPKKNSPTPATEAENVYSLSTHAVAAIPNQIETPSQFLDEGTSYSTQEKTYSSNQLTIDGSNQQKIVKNNSPTPATEAEDVNSPKVPVAAIPKQIETPSQFLDVGTSCSIQKKICSNNQLTKLTQVCEKSSQTEVPCLNPQRRRLLKKKELLETIASKKYRALRKRLLNCLQQLRRKDVELSLLNKLQARRSMINYTPERQFENQIIIHQGVNFLETKSCETCKKEFWLRSSIDFHRCLNGSRPTALSTKLLYCEFCSYESYRGDTMRMHVRIMHGSGARLDPKMLSELFDDTV